MAPTVLRRFRTCVSNCYPIEFTQGDRHLRINIFHCSFFDAEADQPMLPREETELKRSIFDVPRRAKRQQMVEAALGVRTLEFGGDCAAGLRVDASPLLPAAIQAEDVTVGEADLYEALMENDWLPCVVLDYIDSEEIMVELYTPGTFHCEKLGHTGPHRTSLAHLRRRQWEVCRGEVLRIPDGATLTLREGQRLWVQSRGPGQDEPAGRLELGEESSFRCFGGTVENEGILACSVSLNHYSSGRRLYKFEIESTKTVLVDCINGIPDLPPEERSVALQCFTWIFERAYRQMQLRTLGGRGWYLADEGQVLSVDPPETSLGLPSLAPRVFLYKGFAAASAYVARGPCLKVDISVRLIQGQTVLDTLNHFRDCLRQHYQQTYSREPSKEEMDGFLQRQIAGRTCMSRHNQIHYRIQKVCIDKDPTSTFPFEDGEITYLEYFQRRHGIVLQQQQPLLYCPFRAKAEVYLPAEVAFLTGLDDEWKSNKEFSQGLWKGLRHPPREHWQLQGKLMRGLADPSDGQALREWGVEIASSPMKVRFGQLEHEPVYFNREAEEDFLQLRAPPKELQVPTSPDGFARRPWPEVWLRPGDRLSLDRWLIFCSVDDKEAVDRFVEELEPMVGEILDASKANLEIARPTVVTIAANSPAGWVRRLTAFEPPWRKELTRFAVVVLPRTKRREQYYYQLKSLLTFRWDHCCPTQMILGSTLQREFQRPQVFRSILQQILVKKGGFLWAISPLPYLGRSMMVVGLDTVKATKESPMLQALSASCNVYFTSYFSTWRLVPPGEPVLPGPLVREALRHFVTTTGRPPDTVVVFRGGASESQETALTEQEVHHPTEGLLAALHDVAKEVSKAMEYESWASRLSIAYIMARRSVSTRFMTEECENLPSGSYVDEGLVPGYSTEEGSTRFDFYLVSQTYVIGTAKPTLYSVLYNTLTFSKSEIIRLTYRLCAVYMTFAGMVSLPAPLKYAAKVLSLLSKCGQLPEQPTGEVRSWRPDLFFV